MPLKKKYSYESLGIYLVGFTIVFGLIYGLISLLIFGPFAKGGPEDWGILHLLACIFLPMSASIAVYHNIWIRQLLLPVVIGVGVGVAIYSFFNFDDSDLKITLNLCILTVVTRFWIGVFEALAVTGKMTDFWRSFLVHPTAWASEFKMD